MSDITSTDLVYIAILTIITERVTELLVDSEFFHPLRSLVKYLAYRPDSPPPTGISRYMIQYPIIFLDKMVSCGYCASVHVGFMISFVFNRSYFDNTVINQLCCAILLHGLSGIWHILYNLLKRGRVRTYDIELAYTRGHATVETDPDDDLIKETSTLEDDSHGSTR